MANKSRVLEGVAVCDWLGDIYKLWLCKGEKIISKVRWVWAEGDE